MELILVRHGETYFNNAGRIQGWMDPGLNKRGREQARDIVEHLPRDRSFTLLTSPLRRARETAEILQRTLNIPEVHAVEQFRELDQGHWNGLRSDVVNKLDSRRFDQWKTQPLSTNPPAGESLQDLKNRVRNGLISVLEQYESPVLIVAHKVVNSMFLHLAGECDFQSVMQSLPENAAVFELNITLEDLGDPSTS